MVEKGKGGAIVNVSSQAAKVALADHAAYCPSKAALDSLTQCMALELGPHKVGRLSALCNAIACSAERENRKYR
jgi:NAD(P)-dependent dehydrogenase (short-subunit alcohol dehydrogenase family)